MSKPADSPKLINTKKMTTDDVKNTEEMFRFLELCASRSQYCQSLPPRAEYDIGLIPEATQDLRKQVLSIEQFKKSAKESVDLLSNIEERLHIAALKTEVSKVDSFWEDLRKDMIKASKEVFAANKIYDRLKDNGNYCVSYLTNMRAGLNEKWFSVRRFFQITEKKK